MKIVHFLFMLEVLFGVGESEKKPRCNFTNREEAFADVTGPNYNPRLPPNHQVTVEVRILLINFFGVNELDGTVNANLNFYRVWEDERFITKCYHDGYIFEANQIPGRFWIPPVGIGAAIASRQPKTPTSAQWLTFFPDGMLISSTVMIVRISCFKDFSRFPFDPMHCDFVLDPGHIPQLNLTAKWHPTHPVDLTPETNHLATHRILKQEILKLKIEPSPNHFIEVEVCRVHFKRHFFHYILHAYMPNTVTVFVAWLSFFIDYNAIPARVTLGISSLIAMILMYGNLSQGIPKVGYLTSMDCWMLACEVFIFATLLEFAYMCNLKRSVWHDRERLKQKLIAIDKTAQIAYPLAFFMFAIAFFFFTVAV